MVIDEAMIHFREIIHEAVHATKAYEMLRADSHNSYFSEFSVYEGQTSISKF